MQTFEQQPAAIHPGLGFRHAGTPPTAVSRQSFLFVFYLNPSRSSNLDIIILYTTHNNAYKAIIRKLSVVSYYIVVDVNCDPPFLILCSDLNRRSTLFLHANSHHLCRAIIYPPPSPSKCFLCWTKVSNDEWRSVVVFYIHRPHLSRRSLAAPCSSKC